MNFTKEELMGNILLKSFLITKIFFCIFIKDNSENILWLNHHRIFNNFTQESMEHHGFLSILPPVLAIALAIKTRQVFVSLLFGIWLGWIILSDGNFVNGTTATVQALVDVFKDAGNTRTIMFSSLVGALIAFIQRSGGVAGFVKLINGFLDKLEKKKNWQQKKNSPTNCMGNRNCNFRRIKYQCFDSRNCVQTNI